MALHALGDLDVTLPAAAATTALLLAWRAWRMAWCWSVLFGVGVAVVGASKIAFMGWGTGWQAICFKALSGHATGVTALYPTLFYLALHCLMPGARPLGVLAGLVLGALVAATLVATGEHSTAEALAGWLTGALVSMTVIRLAGPPPPARPAAGMLAFAVVFSLAAWAMQSAHIGWWMVKAARLLSGQHKLFEL